MYLNDKKVLVLGLGVTGISTIKALYSLGAKIVVSDTKNEVVLGEILREVSYIPMEKYLDTNDMDLNNIELIIKSPGIPPFSNIVKKAIESKIEVITDIEFAYRISPTKNIVAITGTNGKTTSTILTGEILHNASLNTHVVGNIGTGILDKMIDAKADDVFIIEASSFQLEHTSRFKPSVGLITNITPDHLDWHGSFDAYIKSKFKIFKNQDESDYLVLNYDDSILRELKDKVNTNIIWFSTKEILPIGIYIEDEYIIINDGENKDILMPYKELKVLGKHNLENALGCVGIALALNVELNIIREVLGKFQGVEHRIEYVLSKNGISFYNDSKGTNTDASIKAIEAINEPIILIAGGYDKGSKYESFINSFNGKVKALILLGQTKTKIKEAALASSFTSIYEVDSMKEAVELSYRLGDTNDNILLSPACASWDMYCNYEERGKDFKKEVSNLME